MYIDVSFTLAANTTNTEKRTRAQKQHIIMNVYLVALFLMLSSLILAAQRSLRLTY